MMIVEIARSLQQIWKRSVTLHRRIPNKHSFFHFSNSFWVFFDFYLFYFFSLSVFFFRPLVHFSCCSLLLVIFRLHICLEEFLEMDFLLQFHCDCFRKEQVHKQHDFHSSSAAWQEEAGIKELILFKESIDCEVNSNEDDEHHLLVWSINVIPLKKKKKNEKKKKTKKKNTQK